MTEKKLTPAQLRKWAIGLRATVDQGEFFPDEDHTLLDQVIEDDDALAAIEEAYPTLFNALIRLDEDYARQCEVSQHTECSLDAIDAFVAVVASGREIDGEAPDDNEAADDGEDPDADLGPESRN